MIYFERTVPPLFVRLLVCLFIPFLFLHHHGRDQFFVIMHDMWIARTRKDQHKNGRNHPQGSRPQHDVTPLMNLMQIGFVIRVAHLGPPRRFIGLYIERNGQAKKEQHDTGQNTHDTGRNETTLAHGTTAR